MDEAVNDSVVVQVEICLLTSSLTCCTDGSIPYRAQCPFATRGFLFSRLLQPDGSHPISIVLAAASFSICRMCFRTRVCASNEEELRVLCRLLRPRPANALSNISAATVPLCASKLPDFDQADLILPNLLWHQSRYRGSHASLRR
jgi:hypothetical protein